MRGTNRILIKGKGPNETALEFATRKDVITLDMNGKVLEAARGLESPHETAMHLAVYRSRPEVMSVIHAHPDWVVGLSASGNPLVPLYAGYHSRSIELWTDGIPLYPRSVTIVNDDLGEDFMRVMGRHRACILLGHGITTAGGSVEEATAVSLDLFELARVNHLAYSIGRPRQVPQRDLDDDRQRGQRRVKVNEQSSRFENEPSLWHYYKRLLRKRGGD
jgi:3,4-dihydroxyphthalate decarboxylase